MSWCVPLWKFGESANQQSNKPANQNTNNTATHEPNMNKNSTGNPSTFEQKIEQHRRKINQKSIKKHGQDMIRFFGRIWSPTWPQDPPLTPNLEPRRGHLESNLGHLGHKSDALDSLDQELRKKIKKRSKKGLETQWYGGRGGPP